MFCGNANDTIYPEGCLLQNQKCAHSSTTDGNQNLLFVDMHCLDDLFFHALWNVCKSHW